jgi:tetratricopeptide (TPR) repeat protein
LIGFQALGESVSEAGVWHQLGRVAQEQHQWAAAERYYRKCLAIKEQLGALAGPTGASATCGQLAFLAIVAGRPSEAEGWYKRALELEERVDSSGFLTAGLLNNLANLLTNEVRAGRAPATRLAEARGYAEQALAIKEPLDASSAIWTPLSILAQIAELEGRAEEARAYRRREREAYAAFAGNRYHIDQQFGTLIAAIVAAAKGDVQTREAVEKALSQLEADGWQIAAAVRRIWEGEREWQALAENLGGEEALVVRRVLEMLEQGGEAGA